MAEEAIVTASEEFAEHLMEVLNGGALSLMLSVGHRTGLFDAMASLPPSTSTRSRRLRA
jgi:Rv2258c-like winged HTH domain